MPELASRQHIQNILPIVDSALRKAGVTVQDLDGMAVTYGPGLVGSLLVGLSMIKGISYRWRIPYVGVNHLEAHLLAIQLEQAVAFPYIALLASAAIPCSTGLKISVSMSISAAPATMRRVKLMIRLPR